MYVEKTKTWDDNWNDVIRYEIFQDTKLKELMMIPDGTDIVEFLDKYFVRADGTDELLSNEKVRIAYYDDDDTSTLGSFHVFGKIKGFDIFVKADEEHTATSDRLKCRQILIAERLKYLLLKKRYQHGLRFELDSEYDVWTKTVGYRLYHIGFFYKTTV